MKTYSIKDLQERYGVGEHTLLGFIHKGELRAINVARSTSTRPKWRITQEALSAFERSRTSSPPPPPTTRRRRKAGEVDFY